MESVNQNFVLNAYIAILQLETYIRNTKPEQYKAKRACFQLIQESLEMIEPDFYKQNKKQIS